MKNHSGTMKNQPGTKKKPTCNHENHANQPGTMKNHENPLGTMQNHENKPGTMKTLKTDLEL